MSHAGILPNYPWLKRHVVSWVRLEWTRWHKFGLCLALCCALVFLAGCAAALRQSRVEQVRDLTKEIEQHFGDVQGRFTEEHISTCLTERRKQGAKYTSIGNVSYQPSYFLTCVANTDVGTQEFIQQKPGYYAIAYEVRVPISKPDNVKEKTAMPREQWFYWTRCNYAVEGETIRYQENAKVDVFIEDVPAGSRGTIRHTCMEMPRAKELLKMTRESTNFIRVYKKRAN